MAEQGALRQRRTVLEHEWARMVPQRRAGAGAEVAVRHEITESWARSLASVDPGLACAPPGGPAAGWARSPLRGPVTELADEIRCITEDAGFVAAVTDASGTILWTCGGTLMRRRAERVNFAPGGRWDEPAMGTNALSLALRTGRPATVFSAEHLVAALHGWVCYCAPIHAPDGRVLGVLDLSTTWDRSHPLALPTVRTLTSAIEARLPRGATPVPAALAATALPAAHATTAAVSLTCLGPAARARRGGTDLHLPPRQVEILTLLALEPDGFAPERLRDALYGDRPVTASTFKAEVSHLRRALGGALTTRRYALAVPLTCDAAEVLRALERGDTTAAVERYRGPLLPLSEAPGVRAWRQHLEVGVREAVLASARPEHALRYGARAPYDSAVHEHALRLLGPADPRRGIAGSRLRASRS
ncbi:helix-turn-helix domain-containing protein [Actinacidiphila acididurans]|uniref:Transcriptional regulator n=1 Tax=Actinacidiphila acididurans TaxID=2784346 RepID=A0ABS2U2U3_9ACTN|nr:helix-turn-helix domain-containing protein [Actinacidiphila acididurans]MBM9509912.1 transcriptional regulator [Actinacidiphila acididurans]